MIPKTLTIILLILILWGCDKNTEKHVDDQPTETSSIESTGFSDFLDNIPIAPLPLRISCGFEKTFIEDDFNKKYQAYIPDGFEVVGKIQTAKDLNLILLASMGDILYPYLFTLDNNGKQIDSVYLHISTCAGDPELELSTWSVIEKDLTIHMTDTSKYFNYEDTGKDYIRTLDSTIIAKRTVEMNNSGRFVRTSDEKEKMLISNI